jgi:hypothetical protein
MSSKDLFLKPIADVTHTYNDSDTIVQEYIEKVKDIK